MTYPPEPAVMRLPPTFRSVSLARARLSELATGWGCSEPVIDDARVVLSELVSNGVLHARTELQVAVCLQGNGGLRVEVRDTSSAALLPPVQVTGTVTGLLDEWAHIGPQAPRPTVPTATGRGLAIVSALAGAWGWFWDAGGGKVVWAELGTGVGAKRTQEGSSPQRPAYPIRPVRLIAVPLRLLKGSEDHFDDLFRELQMADLVAAAGGAVDASGGGASGGGASGEGAGEGLAGEGLAGGPRDALGLVAGELAPLGDRVKGRLARLREPLRRALRDAAQRGDRLMDLNLLADAGMPAVFEMCERLLAGSADAARRGLLLTEPPAPEVVAWRRWVRQEIEDQIEGRPPRACPLPATPPQKLESRPGWERLDAARRAALSGLRSVLVAPVPAVAGPGEPSAARDDDVIVKALEYIAGHVGARRSVLALLEPDNETVIFAAFVGFSSTVVDYWGGASSLSADLPTSEVIRTSKALLFRTLAEFDERYPIFLATPSESDPALAFLPLVGAGAETALGCLVIGFAQARDFTSTEVSFLSQLASEVANFVADQRRRTVEQLSATRQEVLGTAAATIARAATKDGVLKELVEVVVALIADGAAAHLVEENRQVRYVLSRHRDPERGAAAEELLRRPRPVDDDDMVSECARTGRRSVLQAVSEEAITAGARDDDDLVLLRKLAIGSVGVVPIVGRGTVLGVVSLGNNVGRFITDEDLDAVQRLADGAGDALARLGGGDKTGGNE